MNISFERNNNILEILPKSTSDAKYFVDNILNSFDLYALKDLAL